MKRNFTLELLYNFKKEVIMMGDCMCKRCHGVYKIVFGALLLLNAFVWPLWMGIDGWIKWLAVLMV